MKKVIYIASALFILPALAFAQQLTQVRSLIDSIKGIVGAILPIVFALILVYFFWGLGTFVLAAGDEDKGKKAKGVMLWGIIALFVAASVWGIVRFIGDSVGINNNATYGAPAITGFQ